MEFYNEIDPYTAAWLRNLSAAGHIGAGAVNETDIRKLTPRGFDLFDRCHFFAGIGVWSYALRVAGWPDAWPVWTGSCPCQPFSGAGKRGGFDDERHLWPDWFRLIEAQRPFVVIGEQVASRDGYAWLDLVQTDMENAGYTFGAVISPVAGFGAPHWRHRIYWMAYAYGDLSEQRCSIRTGYDNRSDAQEWRGPGGRDVIGGLDDTTGARQLRSIENAERKARHETRLRVSGEASGSSRLGNAENDDRRLSNRPNGQAGAQPIGAGPVNGFWANADWLRCTDDKWRPVKSGTFPLVNGASGRVGKLRAYGNAICAPQAIEFIKAAIEVINENLTRCPQTPTYEPAGS